MTHSRRPLDPDAEAMRRIGYQMIDQVVDHLCSLSEQPVAKPGTGSELNSLVDEPLPESPTDLSNCVDFFFERVVPRKTRVNHPRFHAYVPCPSSFAGAIGDMLAAGTNPFVGSWLGGGTVSALEITVLRWIAEMLGYDPEAGGILTSGGSTANLIGLATAREKFGRETLSRGTLYVSAEGHASMTKAASVLGFPSDAIRMIETDDQFRMRTSVLTEQIAEDRAAGFVPFFVSANAGTTNTGAIDPLSELADLCDRENLWFHVDGAYGGFAAIDAGCREQLTGMERADSLTLDPHKWLYCPMGVGCILVRDTELLESAFSADGNYLKDIPADEVNFFDRGPELSRPARVLSVWTLIRSTGRDALAEQIREDIRLAHLAAGLLAEDERFEVQEPGLSIVTFRHIARSGESEAQRGARDDDLMNATLADGDLMLSTTFLHGKNTLRLVVMNHRITDADIIRSVKRIRELAADA